MRVASESHVEDEEQGRGQEQSDPNEKTAVPDVGPLRTPDQGSEKQQKEPDETSQEEDLGQETKAAANAAGESHVPVLRDPRSPADRHKALHAPSGGSWVPDASALR